MNERTRHDDRYTAGSIETWPAWKTARVEALLRELALPPQGAALDFGCGPGVFTEVLARALPGWRIIGTDVSDVALGRARARVPGATFRPAAELLEARERFDLVFTHHVLEHVDDLEATWRDLAALAAQSAHLFHILPCGDPGSFEHALTELRAGGIDRERGGRFFFEDTDRLRRLTTSQVDDLAARSGFVRAAAWYANHRLGAVDWITAEPPAFVRRLTRLRGVEDSRGWVTCALLRAALLPLSQARTLRHRPRARLLVAPLERALGLLRDVEWRARRDQPGGSEMYLAYRRA